MGRGAATDAPSHAVFGRFHQRNLTNPTAPIHVELEQGSLDSFKGMFAYGFSAEMFDQVLPQISDAIGLEVIALWDWKDGDGYYGDAEIMVADTVGVMRELPEEIFEWLYSFKPGDLPGSVTIKRADERTKQIQFAGGEGGTVNGVDMVDYGIASIDDPSTDEPAWG